MKWFQKLSERCSVKRLLTFNQLCLRLVRSVAVCADIVPYQIPFYFWPWHCAHLHIHIYILLQNWKMSVGLIVFYHKVSLHMRENLCWSGFLLAIMIIKNNFWLITRNLKMVLAVISFECFVKLKVMKFIIKVGSFILYLLIYRVQIIYSIFNIIWILYIMGIYYV